MTEKVLDFEWACTQSLRYFKLSNSSVEEKLMCVIGRRLALMPELRKAKFEKVSILADHISKPTSQIASFFSRKEVNSEEVEPKALINGWIAPLQSNKKLCSLNVTSCAVLGNQKTKNAAG